MQVFIIFGSDTFSPLRHMFCPYLGGKLGQRVGIYYRRLPPFCCEYLMPWICKVNNKKSGGNIDITHHIVPRLLVGLNNNV